MSLRKNAEPKNHFTIGINDDVSHTTLDYDTDFSIEDETTMRCLFFGLGADGTVGANKNSIKIIGEETDNYAQGYFYYDSKKSGTVTVSHLRFGPEPIRAPYLISHAQFVACHQFTFLERFDMLKYAEGGTFLLNSIYGPEEVWDYLPREVQKDIIEKKLKFYVIDGYKIAEDWYGQPREYHHADLLFCHQRRVALATKPSPQIKKSIKKTYGKRGEAVVKLNFDAVDHTLANLKEVKVPANADSKLPATRQSPRRRPHS